MWSSHTKNQALLICDLVLPLALCSMLYSAKRGAPSGHQNSRLAGASYKDCCSHFIAPVSLHALLKAAVECQLTFVTLTLCHNLIWRHLTTRKANTCLGESSKIPSNSVVSTFFSPVIPLSKIWSMQPSAASLLTIFQAVSSTSQDVAIKTIFADWWCRPAFPDMLVPPTRSYRGTALSFSALHGLL